MSIGLSNPRRAAVAAMITALAALAFFVFAASSPPPASADDDSPDCYAVNQQDELVRFDCDEPGRIRQRTPIAPLGANEDVVGIDFRPANDLLYATIRDKLTTNFRVATVDKRTGVARTTCSNGPFVGTSSNSFGVDFNPVPDRLRLVSDQNQNLRANVDSAAGCGRIDDGPLRYRDGDKNQGKDPDVTAVGYTNSFRPSPRMSPGTQLFDIDVRQDVLAEQVDPNGGLLRTVGKLDVKVEQPSGFDIQCGNEALAALQKTGQSFSRLYEIDLGDGEADNEGRIGKKELIRGLAIDPTSCDNDDDDDDRDDDD